MASTTPVLPRKFDFNTSILVLVFVVLSGINIWGSIIAATLHRCCPSFCAASATIACSSTPWCSYSTMLVTNSPMMRAFFARTAPHKRGEERKGGGRHDGAQVDDENGALPQPQHRA